VQNMGNDRNSLQVYLDAPISTGVPLGTNLPKPAATSVTSFKLMDARMDFSPDLGIAIRGNGTANRLQVEGIAYTATTATDGLITPTAGALNDGGGTANAGTLTATGALAPFNGGVLAYRNSPDGKVTSNVGNTTPNTGASYGAAGTTGWEMSFSRAAMGLTANGTTLRLFVLQNNGDGGFLSSDFIPQQTPGTAGAGTSLGGFYSNPTTSVNFRDVPGLQVAEAVINATSITLGTKAADAAAIGLSIYPNPSEGASTVQYAVTERASNVNIVLTDLVGRSVRVLENSIKAVGTQRTPLNTSNLAAGSYLVRVQVGERVSTSKVSVL